MVKGASDKILVVIQITILTAQLQIRPLFNKLCAHFDEIFRTALCKQQLIKFLCDLDHYADSLSQESGQDWGNELPWPSWSALSECLCDM